MDLDRGSEPRNGKVQRSSKRPEVRAVYVALCMLVGPTEIYLDNRCVVQAKRKSEVNCSSAGHKDADLRIIVWEKTKITGW